MSGDQEPWIEKYQEHRIVELEEKTMEILGRVAKLEDKLFLAENPGATRIYDDAGKTVKWFVPEKKRWWFW